MSCPVMSPVEERAIDAFAAWLIASIEEPDAQEGIASLVKQIKAELPVDWRAGVYEVKA